MDHQPLSLFRYPGENKVKGYFQKNNKLHKATDFERSGFIFSSFQDQDENLIFPLNQSQVEQTILNNNKDLSSLLSQIEILTDLDKAKEKHLSLIGKAIFEIKNKKINKVVLSRKQEYQVGQLDSIALFRKLCFNYLDAMVYMWYHPKVGLWLGATPELLLDATSDNFKTISLAGTRREDMPSGKWSEKEIEEQRLVTDFIKNQLQSKFNVVRIKGPFTAKAGNLLHLKTEIKIEKMGLFNEVADVIKLLHPTPAVCGFPKSKAYQFIKEEEGYHRKFYTGYLGEWLPSDKEKRATLFVNLRCLEVYGNILSIYVGGGITSGSDPEKEWNETMNKSQTMTDILFEKTI